ncbi:MAG TPA: hypothetical protein PKY82_02495 [Pyrinomonadaceae bacterium]|nr:hypothetical protein [Pyrinomonadaceae bacterium]
MQILTFIATFLLFTSKFERQGGFVGICLGFIFVALMIFLIVGAAFLIETIKKK